MKSKKIIAMIVAFAAFMAVATSGLAAVSTTTTYNADAEKVLVNVDVTAATENSEVTYLVKNGNDIVYIDQKTASGSGAVNFNYKIDKDEIADLNTTVKFGTNGLASIDDTTPLVFNQVANTSSDKVTVKFYTDAACEDEVVSPVYGNNPEDKIYAKIIGVAEGYEIDQITGLEESAGDVYVVTGTTVSVTVKESEKDPAIDTTEDVDNTTIQFTGADANEEAVKAEGATVVTTLIKVVGKPTKVWVEVDGIEYKALTGVDEANYVDGGVYAVRIIDKDGSEFEAIAKCE